MSYCVHSFHFLQSEFLPSPPRFRLIRSMNKDDLTRKAKAYAYSNPVRFVAAGSFLALGAIPLGAFVVYAVLTLIASIIGAFILEVVLLGVGIAALAFVLVVVGCLTSCIVSAFAALYYSYRVANSTFQHARRARGRAPSSSSPPPAPDYSQTLTETETDEPFDKNKADENLELVSSILSLSEVDYASDFFRTALMVLILLFSITVMMLVVIVTAYFVVNFT